MSTSLSSSTRLRPLVAALLALSICLVAPCLARADRAFTPRFSTNDTGNITIAANSLMTCPAAAANCVAGRNGAAQNDNSFNMEYVDADGEPSTFDSSAATLRLPPEAQVLFAGLYWGADVTAGSGGQPARDASAAARSTVLVKAPGQLAPQALGPTGTVLDTATGTYPGRYQGFLDVTGLVRSAGAGTYTVGNVQAGTGADRYAGWGLVVAYRDTSQPARNLSVFDGFKTVLAADPPTSISLAGFITPPAGPVRTTLGFVSYEGDRGLVGDTASLNGTKLTDAANPATNFFNSSIAEEGADVGGRQPSYANQLGFDADLVNAAGVLGNEASSATIGLTTSGDAYYPGAVTFATELYAPDIDSTNAVEDVTHPGGPVQRGDVLRYTVGYANAGQDGADAFVVRNEIPSGTTYLPKSLRILSGAGAGPLTDAAGDDQAEYEAENRRITFRLGNGGTGKAGGRVAAGAKASFSFEVKVDAGLTDGTTIADQATARFFGQSLGTPLSNLSPVARSIVSAPEVSIGLSHQPALVAGSNATFTIVVDNHGSLGGDGTPVKVSDEFPAGALEGITLASAPGWSCAVVAGRVLECERSDVLAAGGTYPPIQVSAHVHDPVPATVVDTARVEGGGDADLSDNAAVDVGEGSAAADLRLTATTAKEVVASGSRAEFELTVVNGGPSAAAGVVVEDPLGGDYEGAIAVTTSGECTAAVRCTIPSLPAGGEVTIQIGAKVTANATTLLNTATVTAAAPTDPEPGNDSASVSFVVPNTTDLRATVSASPTNPPPGVAGAFTYTLTTEDRGPGTAAGITVIDSLPELFTPTATSAPGFECNSPAAGGVLRCLRATLSAAEGPQTITVTGTVAADAGATELLDSVRVRSETLDPEPENNLASLATMPSSAADLELVAEGPSGRVTIGEEAGFTITATNHGPASTAPTTVVDRLPAGLEFASASTGCSFARAAREVVCPIASLAAGTSTPVTVKVTPTAAVAGQAIENTATVGDSLSDPIPSNNSSTDTLRVAAVSDLALSATVAPAEVGVGDPASFTFAARNDGPNPATGVSLVDKLPDGLRPSGALPEGCAAEGAKITCALGEVAAGAVGKVTLALAPEASLAGTTVSDPATVSATTADPDPADNDAVGTLRVEAAAGGSPEGPPGTPGTPGNGDSGGSGNGNDRGESGAGNRGGGGGNGGAPSGGGGRGSGGTEARAGAGRAALKLRLRGPRRARVGHAFRYRLTVRSVGNGALRGVKVCARLSRRLRIVRARGFHVHGGRACRRVKSLAQHRRRRFTIRVRPKPGANRYRISGRAVARATNAKRRTTHRRRTVVLPGGHRRS